MTKDKYPYPSKTGVTIQARGVVGTRVRIQHYPIMEITIQRPESAKVLVATPGASPSFTVGSTALYHRISPEGFLALLLDDALKPEHLLIDDE